MLTSKRRGWWLNKEGRDADLQVFARGHQPVPRADDVSETGTADAFCERVEALPEQRTELGCYIEQPLRSQGPTPLRRSTIAST